MNRSTDSTIKPIAVITGAASGLGLELARQLSASHQLVLVDIDIVRLQTQASDLPGALCFSCDLSEHDKLAELISTLKAQLPKVDLLINNAGITHRSLGEQTEHQVICKVMAVDYLAPVQLTQGLLPLLRQASGKVVNIGSMAGWMPVLGRSGYCAAKSALHQYFETLRAELHFDKVSILMVYPSFLDTPIEQNALDGRGQKASHKRSMVGKMRSSEWMAKLILKAIEQQKTRIFSDKFTYISSLLYRLFPSVYLHLMRNKFASELQVRS